MRHGVRFVIVSALAIVAAGTAGFFGGMYAWRYLNRHGHGIGETESGCDLQRGACRARFPNGGEMVVWVAPLPVPLVNPVRVSIELLNMRAEAVDVDLSSPDVRMGCNRRPLRAIAHSRSAAYEAAFVFETAANRARVSG